MADAIQTQNPRARKPTYARTKFGTVPEPRALTQERVRRLLHYDPAAGLFVWRGGHGGIRPGQPAGSPIQGYNVIRVDGRNYRASHLAFLYMLGDWPPDEVDHRDCDQTNDRWLNLRPANSSQNKWNMRVTRRSRSGLRGVYAYGDRWRAQICHKRVFTHLGVFDSIEEAHAVYMKKASELYGEFARRS